MSITSTAGRGARWNPFGAGCGIVFAVLLVVGGVLRGAPPETYAASPDEITAYFSDNRSRLLASAYLSTVAVSFFLIFLGRLWRAVRDAEGEGGWLATVVLGAGVTASAVAVAGNAFWGAAAFRADGRLDPALGTALFDLGNLFYQTWLPAAVLLAASAAAALVNGGLPRWLGWAGAGTALILVVGGIPGNEFFDKIGFLAFFAYFLWIVAASIVLLRARPLDP